MLTAANVSSEMAVNYFVKNYYHQGKSRWSGQGAEKLGLSGEIDNEDAFKNVIEGRSPQGSEQLNARVVKGKGEERRAALDCTFSAPKSVSLMALVGGDARLIDAHHQALKEVLQLIEQRYVYTRVTDDNGRHRVKTGNLVVAQFDHIESRELDPHLHTHCLLMNMTQTPDGRWLSLGNSEIFANKKFLGMTYQSFLAREVQKLGYEVEQRQHGQFEIKGFKQQELEAFSKRRQQIIAASGANSTWAEREKIWDQTRQRKQKVTEDELKSLWQQEVAALGLTFVKGGEPSSQQADEIVEQKSLIDALNNAIAHCNERNVAFTQEDLEKFILEERLATDLRAIEPLIREHQELIVLPGLERQYTTWDAVKREIATIGLMSDGQGKVNPMLHPEVAQSYLEKTSLNTGQRQAVQLAATTSDQFIAWQGVAGAGKTFALSQLKALATDAGYTIIGFAPSSAAAKVLSQELEVQSETVARLLVTEPPPLIEPNQVWIVDEAGLLSAKDAYALLQRATQEQARVILVGDTRQMSAVEAGNPFKSLQQAGIETAYMNESLRQKDPELKLAVDLIADGRIEAGFERLLANGSIKTVDAESKAEAIASDYMAATPQQRAKTLVLAGTNIERLSITQAIRSHLKDEGTLGEIATITQLQTKNLSKVQMRFAHNFEIGDVVMPTRDYKRRGLTKGQLYEVVGQTTDSLTLKSDDGKHLEVDTAFDKAVYQRQEIEIAVGDHLQWKKNDRQLERRNGQGFVVAAIAGGQAEIKYLDSDRSESISLSQAQNLDYALVSTTYSSQGKTADHVLISADHTIGQESFYVAASRARHELKIYTEDPARLVELAQESKAKENALELLRQQVRQKKAEFPEATAIFINIDVDVAQSPKPKPKAAKQMPCPAVEVKQTGTEVIGVPNRKQGTVDFSAPILISPPPTVAFWTPEKTEAPNHIEAKHWLELVEESAIHPDIAKLNFKTLQYDVAEGQHEAWGRLLYSEKFDEKAHRINTGVLVKKWLDTYAHLDHGGWWCSAGVDPRSFLHLEPGQQPQSKLWGCLKPNNPRAKADKPGKFIKYEHPPQVEGSIFLLDVPEHIADKIYKKAGVEPSLSERASGFWYCVWKHNIPITLTEGAKKAASLLSQGHATIGLPGITTGYRREKTVMEDGTIVKGEAHLHQELAPFATKGRSIKFCFDYETKPETKQNIESAISTTGKLLKKVGASVSVVDLIGPEKGADDFIVAQGGLAYEKLSHQAMKLSEWKRWIRDMKYLRSEEELPKRVTPQEQQQRLEVKATMSPNAIAMSEKFRKQLELMRDEDLAKLDLYIADYFKEHENEDDLQTQGLRVVRKVLLEQQAEILEKSKKQKLEEEKEVLSSEMELKVSEMIEKMSNEELGNLVLEVMSYFKKPHQENDPQFEQMKVIRGVMKSMKSKIIERVADYKEELDQSEQIRLRH
ncbi:conjugative relaxase [Komarekiella sp. 'clone 1']|uniref:Conjugative relaxase n=1 Tax=Komarekiella delphini-convector SJRDD-AB1 TaxID=2593771 RepID=A0AA40T4T0_9NOST|nr:MobF family relaxase [Komarekiella delphini-convector]MBD6620632.1 conjugative relaxase [Komarekiella delphini-convector SJRDD-AB1]